jgi:hypothetical protein
MLLGLAPAETVAVVSDHLSPQIQRREAENFLYTDGNPYVGPQAVAEGIFQRIVSDIENFDRGGGVRRGRRALMNNRKRASRVLPRQRLSWTVASERNVRRRCAMLRAAQR